MYESFDLEIFEVFYEQLEEQLPLIENDIVLLKDKDTVSQGIDELFRYFHTFKATASYLSLENIVLLSTQTEMLLSSLRDTKISVQESIIEWLSAVVEQFYRWLDELADGTTQLSAIPPHIQEQIKISQPYISTSKKLKKLSLVYIDSNLKRAKKIVEFLKNFSKQVEYLSDFNKLNNLLNSKKAIDIIIINLNEEDFYILDSIKEILQHTPIIPIFDKISNKSHKKLIKNGISHSTTNPINGKVIKEKLSLITKAYFSSSTILADNKTIKKFIETLEPLPNTILQIMQICDDDDIPIKELIKVVKKDPIVTATILKSANSPMYGSVELKTIDQAISRLGKNSIKVLCLSGVYDSLGSIDLSAYQINEEIFSKVSIARLSLILKWYSKISIADLSLLSSTALLGNIGQLLISKEISKTDRSDMFDTLAKTFGIKYAEEFTMHTTTPIISAEILSYWKLADDIIAIIMFSDNPSEAPKDLRKLTVANHIVYRLVDLKGNISKEIPQTIIPLLEKYNFDIDILENSLKILNNRLPA